MLITISTGSLVENSQKAGKPPMQYFAVPELVVRESSIGAAASHANTAIKAPRKHGVVAE